MAGRPQDTQVLVVDDDVIMGELLSALMTVEGYRVTRAGSGEEALSHLQKAGEKPDVILCDIHMPGMQGGELATALLAARVDGTLPANTSLLAMSGSAPRDEDARSFDGFLRKPFTIADFAEAVANAQAQQPQSAAPNGDEFSAKERRPLDEKIFGQLRSKIGRESLRQLYEMTLDDVRARVGRIATAARSGDQPTVRHEAHTIKGSCGMVGALELQALAAATEGGSPVDTSALADFDSACQRLQRMLNERL
jgi:CheY-like chemotaxis protein/HPt (histidine-containing phosphotransfer) domain-containing protein